MNRTRRLLLIGAAALLAGPALAVEPPAPPLSGPALLTALRAGGLIIYFRHATTEFGPNDEKMTGYEDCAHQRNLNERGRAEARQIGEAIRRLAIPVGDVQVSPFCRTMETAQLIFGRATSALAVRGGPAAEESPERYAELRNMLSTSPPAGIDLAIVGHGNPFAAVVGPPYLAEGEAAVIRPLEGRGFVVVARIPKDGWAALATP